MYGIFRGERGGLRFHARMVNGVLGPLVKESLEERRARGQRLVDEWREKERVARWRRVGLTLAAERGRP